MTHDIIKHSDVGYRSLPNMFSVRLQQLMPSIIESPRMELRQVEFKESQPWDVLKGKLIKGALAMANLRDGGVIIVGVEDGSAPHFIPTPCGMSDGDYSTYDPQQVQDAIAQYASEPFGLYVHKYKHNSKHFVLIDVDMFKRTPIFAKKDFALSGGKLLIQKGKIYCRSIKGRPSTREVEEDEMSEIIDIASDVRVREFLEKAQRVGLDTNRTRVTDLRSVYEKELGDF